MTHLTLITFLILATITVACMWRENQVAQLPAVSEMMGRGSMNLSESLERFIEFSRYTPVD